MIADFNWIAMITELNLIVKIKAIFNETIFMNKWSKVTKLFNSFHNFLNSLLQQLTIPILIAYLV